MAQLWGGWSGFSYTRLKILGQFLQEGLILPIAQEAVCVYTVVLAIETKVQSGVRRLSRFVSGHKSDLRRGSPKV